MRESGSETWGRIGRIVFPLSMYNVKDQLQVDLPKSLQLLWILLFLAASLGAFLWRGAEAYGNVEKISLLEYNATNLELQGYQCRIMNQLTQSISFNTFQEQFSCTDLNGEFLKLDYRTYNEAYFPDYRSCVSEISSFVDNCDDSLNSTVQVFVGDGSITWRLRLFPFSFDFDQVADYCSCLSSKRDEFAVFMCDPFSFTPPYACTKDQKLSNFAVLNSSLNFRDFAGWVCVLLVPLLILISKRFCGNGTAPSTILIHPFLPEAFFDLKQSTYLQVPLLKSWIVLFCGLAISVGVCSYAYLSFLNDTVRSVEYIDDYSSQGSGLKCKRARVVEFGEFENLPATILSYYTSSTDCITSSEDAVNLACFPTMRYGVTTRSTFSTQKDCTDAVNRMPLQSINCNFGSYGLDCAYTPGGTGFFFNLQFHGRTTGSQFEDLKNYSSQAIGLKVFNEMIDAGFPFEQKICDFFRDNLYGPFECEKQVPKYTILQKLSLLSSLFKFCFTFSRIGLTFVLKLMNCSDKAASTNSEATAPPERTLAQNIILKISPISMFSPQVNQRTIMSMKKIMIFSAVVYALCLGLWITYFTLGSSRQVLQYYTYEEVVPDANKLGCTFLGPKKRFSWSDPDDSWKWVSINPTSTFKDKEVCMEKMLQQCESLKASGGSLGIGEVIGIDSCQRILQPLEDYCEWYSSTPALCAYSAENTLEKIGNATGLTELFFALAISFICFFAWMKMRNPKATEKKTAPVDTKRGPE